MEIYVQCTAEGLVPLFDSDWEGKKTLKEGLVYKAEITVPRNYQFHKKFFALLRLTFENLPERIQQSCNIHNEQDMLDCLKLDLGLYTIVYHNHEPFVKLGSISFAKMDEAEFRTFYNRCVDTILYNYLKGLDKETLLEEINNFR